MIKMKRIFLDLDGTLARFNVRNALSRFETEKGFFANLLAYKGIENINDYINSNSEVIAYCDTIEQAKEYEKSLIGIVQLEQEQWGLDVVCLNSNDKPIKVKEQGYELRL